MKTYKVSKQWKRFESIILGGFGVLSGIVVLTIYYGDAPIGVIFFYLIWLMFVGRIIFIHLRKPNIIDLDLGSKKLRFYNKFISKEYSVDGLSLIKSSSGGQELEFEFYDKSKIGIAKEIDGLHELITLLIGINKNIKTNGC
jgi:hypothetical protein